MWGCESISVGCTNIFGLVWENRLQETMVFFGIPKKHFEHKVQYTIYNLKLVWLPGLGRIGDPKNCELPRKLEIQFMADLDLGYPSKINWFLKCSCFSYQKGDNVGQYFAAVQNKLPPAHWVQGAKS